MVLRDYQEQAKGDIGKFISDSQSKMGLLVSPVAAGKSIYTAITADMVNDPVLVIQPTKELLLQNVEKARIFDIDPTIYSASLKSKEISNITYATPMSIVKNPEDFKRFKYVIIDEAHNSMTNTVVNGKVSRKSKLAEFLQEIQPKKMIGLTATPIQLVSTGFGGSILKMINRSMRSAWYKAEMFHVTQIDEIHQNYWSDVEIHNEPPEDNFLELNSSGSEFKEESIIRQYEENNINLKVQKKYEELSRLGRKSILTFVPSIKHANELKKYLSNGSVVLTSHTKPDERDQIITDFKSGKIHHLINCGILTEGFDYPGLDAIIMARETNSFVLYYQIFGRLVRPLIIDGNVMIQKDIFADLTNNTNRFGDIRNISFEQQDYTNGWAMFNGDKLLTGYPTGNWDMPTRETLQKEYKKSRKKTSYVNTTDFRGKEITFGKYKGKTLGEVADRDMKYLIWAYENMNFSKPWLVGLKKAIAQTLHQKTIETK